MDTYDGPVDILPPELFNVARLEEGFKMSGYANGEKVGAKEQAERRRVRPLSHPPRDPVSRTETNSPSADGPACLSPPMRPLSPTCPSPRQLSSEQLRTPRPAPARAVARAHIRRLTCPARHSRLGPGGDGEAVLRSSGEHTTAAGLDRRLRTALEAEVAEVVEADTSGTRRPKRAGRASGCECRLRLGLGRGDTAGAGAAYRRLYEGLADKAEEVATVEAGGVRRTSGNIAPT